MIHRFEIILRKLRMDMQSQFISILKLKSPDTATTMPILFTEKQHDLLLNISKDQLLKRDDRYLIIEITQKLSGFSCIIDLKQLRRDHHSQPPAILQEQRRYNQERQPRIQEPRRMQTNLLHHCKGNCARCFRKILITNKRWITNNRIKLTSRRCHPTHKALLKEPSLTMRKEIF